MLKISAGQTVSTTLSPAEEDVFQFEAKAGTYYKFSLDYPANAQARFFMSVLGDIEPGPRGDNSYSSIDNGWDLLPDADFVAAKSGKYEFSVTALDAARAGPYRLTLTSKTDDHANSRDRATAITGGKLMHGVMEYDGDTDYFVLNAKAGRKYSLTLTSDSDHYSSWVGLRSEDKSLREIGDTPPQNSLSFTAGKSGKYYFYTVGQIYSGPDVKYAITVNESEGKARGTAGRHKGRRPAAKAHHHRRAGKEPVARTNGAIFAQFPEAGGVR